MFQAAVDGRYTGNALHKTKRHRRRAGGRLKTTILIGVVIVAVLTAPLGWYFASRGGDAANPEITQLRVDLDALAQKNRDLTIDMNALTRRFQALEDSGVSTSSVQTFAEPEEATADLLADSFSQVVLIANRREVNNGLSNSGSSYLTKLFGLPRPDLSENCQSMTNPLLKELVRTESVGPIRVTMLEPAVLALRQVFRNVKIFEPELYARINTAGSLCVRHIRGRPGSVSTHAYGLSVDLNIDGKLDTLGDGKTQLGLILLADFFRKEGWYWGAGFGREDSMHFQVSREKIDQWLRQGLIRGK